MIKIQNVKRCMKQTSVKGLPAHVSVAYLDKHSTLNPVMVSVVGSIPTGGNFLLKLFETLDVISGLKCKCHLIVKISIQKNSIVPWVGVVLQHIRIFFHLLRKFPVTQLVRCLFRVQRISRFDSHSTPALCTQ